MTTSSSRAQRIFHRLTELPEGDREGFLETACGSDPELRARVECLLAADRDAPASFLVTDGDKPDSLRLPDQMGDFEILDRLGEGGMGTVYVALQRSPRREVALKVLRLGRVSKASMARFQREIEVLGNLRHPGIAQIYQASSYDVVEAGSSRQLPFFTMELVRGPSIVDYANATGLDVPARVELFCLVCDAVHHAHLQGVVHRDLKAANVLVTDESTVHQASRRGSLRIGQPKVLDFGIARFADSEVASSEATRAGDVIGTLTNISPEQLRGDTDSIDPRSDVYSLGVLLFQLLTGRFPIEVTGMSVPQALRALETGRPLALHEVRSELRGDLSVVVGKALDPVQAQRYTTASDLAADLRRYLDGEPVHARSHSKVYLLSRSLQRHRAFAAAAGLIMALLLAFVFVYRHQAIDNRRLAARETLARQRAERSLRESFLAQGRLLGRTGSFAGEAMLWSSFLDDDALPASRWALREFYATHPCIASRQMHAGNLRSVVIREDRTVLASVADDGWLRFSHPETLEEVLPPIEVPSLVFTLVFRPHTSEIVLGTETGAVEVWDTESGERTREWKASSGTVRHMSASADGRILTCGADDGASLWTSDGSLLRRFEEVSGVVFRMQLSPGGDRLVIAGSRGLWLVEDPLHGQPVFLDGHRRAVSGAVFSQGGRVLYTCGADGRILEWNLAAPGREPRLVWTGERPRSLWAGRRNDELVVLHSNRVELLDTVTGKVRRSIPLVDFSRTLSLVGDRLAVGDRQGGLRVWALRPTWRTPLGSYHESVVAGFDRGGVSLLVGDGEGLLQAIEVATGRVQATRSVEDFVTWVEVAPDGSWFWATSAGSLWAAASGDAEAREVASGVLARRSPVFSLSPDGTRIALACSDRMFRVVDSGGGPERIAFETGGDQTYAVAWAPDGRWIATIARNEEQVVLRDAQGLEKDRVLSVEGMRPLSLAFAPDTRRLFVGTWERAVQVWNLEDGQLETTLEGHDGPVWDVTVLQHREPVLASLGAEGKLRLWDIERQKELAALPFDSMRTRAFLFTHPGAPLVLADADASLERVDLQALDRSIERNEGFVRKTQETAESGPADPLAPPR